MIHIALCDDNELHLAATERLIHAQAAAHDAGVAVVPFSSADALRLAFENGELTAELAILDIDLSGGDGLGGIALAKCINAVAPCCQIIFLTGYAYFAMDVYEAEHAGFVVKDKQEERLWPAIERAYARYNEACKGTITLRSGAGAIALRFGEIVCLEHQGRKTCLRLTQREVQTRETLDALEKRLPERFLRCHKSVIVNLDYVRELGVNVFVLHDGTVLPISRIYKKHAEERFWAYMRALALGEPPRTKPE